MPDINLMKFFVTGEGGTSSLLATAFDPQFADERQRVFRQRFCNRLKEAGVILSADEGPSDIRQEYADMDLVMAWGSWILIIENKVAQASITPNQLNRYYTAVLKQIRHGTFFDDKDSSQKHICFVFLTPTENMGSGEFASLDLTSKDCERADAKVHLSWTTMLDDLRQAFPAESANDPLGRLIRNGCERTEGILKKNQEKGNKTFETAERNATKTFMKALRSKIDDLMKFDPPYKLTDWNAPELDELYGNIAGDDGNVYFTAFPTGTNLVDRDQGILNGKIRFQVAAKAPKSIRNDFRSVPSQHWELMLGLDPGSLERDDAKWRVVFEEVWEGRYADLVDQIASLFCRFLVVFRPFMASHGDPNNSDEVSH